MESEAPLPVVASLKPPLNPHDAKTVAKQLCYRIPESQDSLYFILRGLGLPFTGELGTTPRVEVGAKEYPTLWRALDCLGVPHDGKLMIIKAESPSLDVLCEKKGDRLRGVRPSSASRRGSKPSAESLPEPKVRSAPNSRPLSAHASSGYPAAMREILPGPKATQTATASNAVPPPIHPLGPTRLFHSASEPKLSAARAKELLERITKPLGDLGDLKEISSELVEKALRRPASAPMSAEEQRRRCESLARPKAQPSRYRQRCKFRARLPAAMVAAQRASVVRLSRPRQQNRQVKVDDSLEEIMGLMPREPEKICSNWREDGTIEKRQDTAGDFSDGGWMFQVMKQNAQKHREERTRYTLRDPES